MATITASGVHADEYLTSVSVAYAQSEAGFVANKVFPEVPVEKQSDKYYVFPMNDWMRDEAQKRAPLTESEGNTWRISEGNYFADVWAFHHDLSDQMLANADTAMRVEANATRLVAQKMMIRRERQWFTDYFNTGIWSTNPSISFQWDNPGSDPIANVGDAAEAIHDLTGFDPNTLVIGSKVLRQLKSHPDIIERIKYTTAENVSASLIARMFEIDRVLVSKGIYATNNEGETDAYADHASKGALLLYVPPSAGLEIPSAGYTFTWDGVSDGAGGGIGTSRIEMPLKRGIRIESQQAWDNKVVAPTLGAFIANVIA